MARAPFDFNDLALISRQQKLISQRNQNSQLNQRSPVE